MQPPVSPGYEPQPTAQDVDHIRMLRIGHIAYAIITGVFALLFAGHLVMGIAMLSGSMPMGPSPSPFPSDLFGWVFIVAGAVAIIAGETIAGLSLYAARCLRQHRRRTLCLVIACLNLLNMPLGTALGVLTLIKLLDPGVKTLFDRAEAAHSTG